MSGAPGAGHLGIEHIIASCALVRCSNEPKGTAYLVRSDLALTCDHVVAGASAERTTLTFRGLSTPAPIRQIERYSEMDVAVLVLDPVERPVLRLTPVCREGAAFRTYGFPQRGKFEGAAFWGAVRNPHAEKNGMRRIQLYSDDLAAGMGAPINGVSGGPIVVGDRVIGTASDIRTDAETKQAMWGHVFAIPSDAFLKQLGDRVSAAGSGPPPRDPRIRLAARVGRAKVRAALAELEHQPGAAGATLSAAEALIALGEPRAALGVLDSCPAGDRREQLQALALAKSGQKERAIEILEGLFARGVVDAETGGILGGRYREQWLKQPGNRGLLERSYAVYRRAYAESRDPYPGINVAALALSLGEPKEARRVAAEVLRLLEEEPPQDRDHWRIATRAGACLITEDFDEARKAYREAIAAEPTRHQDIAVMRREARRNLKNIRGADEHLLDDVFPSFGVVAFFGQLVDNPKASATRALREALRDRLPRLNAAYGFCSTGCGPDLIFIDVMLNDCGAHVKAFLPTAQAEFEKSLREPWVDLFQRLTASPNLELVTVDASLPEQRPWKAVHRDIRESATELGRLLDESPVALAAWDEQPGDTRGLAAALADWEQGVGEVMRLQLA